MGRKIKKELYVLLSIVILWNCIFTPFMAAENNYLAKNPPLSFLTFKYDEDGKVGTLAYENIEGEKIVVADKVIGNSMYFGLDTERNFIYYLSEDNTLWGYRIGEKPVEIVAGVKTERLFLSKDERYMMFTSIDKQHVCWINIFDKKNMVNKQLKTASSEENMPCDIEFNDDSLELVYESQKQQVYYSKQYEKLNLIAQDATIGRESDFNEIYVYADDSFYSKFATGPMKNEQFGEFVWQLQVLPSSNALTYLFIDENSNLCLVKENGDRNVIVERTRQFTYFPDSKKLYYINHDSDLVCVKSDLKEEVDPKDATIIAKNIYEYHMAPNHKQIVYGSKDDRKIYLTNEKEQILVNDQEIDFYGIYDFGLIYWVGGKLYIRMFDQATNKVGEEKCIGKVNFDWDDSCFWNFKDGYIVFFEEIDGKKVPKYYDIEQDKVMAVLPNIEEYDIVKVIYHIYTKNKTEI